MAFIRFDDVTYKIKGKTILENVSVELEQDSFTTLVGSNGAGKTTLSKLLLGVIKATKGEVWLDEQRISDYPRHEVGMKLGYLFQNPNVQLFAPTIREELSFASEYKGIDPEVIRKNVDELIERFSLQKALKTPTYHLSQGEKQRVAIAAMLMNKPKYIVLDEPTTGLDYEQRTILAETLQTIHSKNIGMLLISHDEAFISQMPGEILEIQDGSILGKGLK